MSHDDLFWQTEFEADLAHFVFEQFAQGLDELHAHFFWQAANVVVRFDDMRFAGPGAGGFDDVGIDRSLCQPLDGLELVRLLVEYLDEVAADDLALVFRVADALERLEETVGGIDANDVDAEVLRERVHDLIALVMPQQACVNEHTHELIADRLVQQRGYDR